VYACHLRLTVHVVTGVFSDGVSARAAGMPCILRALARARPLDYSRAPPQISLQNGPSTLLFLQCPNGHTLCNECSMKCNTCPSCRATPTNIRCLALEKAGRRVTWPCRYAGEGCEELLEFEKAEKHFEECLYRLQECCPYRYTWGMNSHRKCEAKMSIDEATVVRHLVSDHGLEAQTAKGIGTKAGWQFPYRMLKSVYVEKSKRLEDPILIKHQSHHFMLHYGTSEDSFRFSISALGKGNEFESKIWCTGDNGRKVEYCGPALSHCPLSYGEGLTIPKFLAWWEFGDQSSVPDKQESTMTVNVTIQKRLSE
jgi:hypothetical protein